MGNKRPHPERKATEERKYGLTDEQVYELNPVVRRLQIPMSAKPLTDEQIHEEVRLRYTLISLEIEAGKLPPEYGISYTIVDRAGADNHNRLAAVWIQTYFPVKPAKAPARFRASKPAAPG